MADRNFVEEQQHRAEQSPKVLWALIELFGHNRIAGKVTEAEFGGGQLIRVDVPAVKNRDPLTKYYNVKAIYGITPVDEDTCRRMAESIEVAPISEYSLEREIMKRQQPALRGMEAQESEGEDAALVV